YLIQRHAFGAILDAPFVTGFWLRAYADRASSVMLVDQSPRMLELARRKADERGVLDRCTFGREDLMESAWPNGAFDTILAAFFLCLLDEHGERQFFEKVRAALRPGGKLLVVD